MKIRPIKKQDLEVLNKKLAHNAFPWLHGKNLKEQEKGGPLWLIAWKEKDPIAHVQIQFDKPPIKEIKKHIKNCPHLGTLYVKEKNRKKGIAKKIMNFAEELVKNKGFKKIGLSVEKDNDFLKNMYKRMKYKDWKKGTVMDSWIELDKKGKKKQVNEECVYLVKELK